MTIGESWLPNRILITVKANDADEKNTMGHLAGSVEYSITARLQPGDEDEYPSTASFATSSLDGNSNNNGGGGDDDDGVDGCKLPVKVHRDTGMLTLCRKVDYANDNG